MSNKQIVTIPYEPRPLQHRLHENLKRWNIVVAHRRFGKTTWAINHLLRAAFQSQSRDPRYFFISPYYSQAKRNCWDFLKYYAGVIPGTKFNESELRCDLPNGARITLLGADNAQSLRGIGADGVILDEYAQMHPSLYSEIISPTLVDRKGFVVFVGTPQGMANDFYSKWVHAQSDDGWYSEIFRAADTGIIDDVELEQQRKLMSDELFNQEYNCSFSSLIVGSYYAKIIENARLEGRIGKVSWDPSLPVFTFWDLGMADSTAIWFMQRAASEVRVIDYYENSGEGLGFYINMLSKKPYVYDVNYAHSAPHDIKVRELGTGKSRWDIAAGLGVRFNIVPNLPLEDGIEAVRLLLKNCWIDSEKCEKGIKALENYKNVWDEKNNCFKNKPHHDWTSHASDGFRYMAVGIDRAASVDDRTWNIPLPTPAHHMT